MSFYSLPCLYLNLGSEMLFILEQRLHAQKISAEKQQKVLRDIVGNFLNDSVLSSLFTPQPAPSKKRLKTNFQKLAHCSIMKLNPDAMDKLFDLMLMAVKYQTLLCKSGHELIMLILSHLDSIRLLIDKSPELVKQVNKTCTHMLRTFSDFNSAQLTLIKYTILNVLQDYHKKVSVFLSQNIQLQTGRFVLPVGGAVPHGSEIPGKVVYHYNEGSTDSFTVPVTYTYIERKGSLHVIGDRGITQPLNLYGKERKKDVSKQPSVPKMLPSSSSQQSLSEGSHTELDILQHLLIGFQDPSKGQSSTFKLSLFDEEDTKGTAATATPQVKITSPNETERIVRIANNYQNPTNDEMKKILNDFQTTNLTSQEQNDEEQDDDLLSLMDKL